MLEEEVGGDEVNRMVEETGGVSGGHGGFWAVEDRDLVVYVAEGSHP